VALYNRESQLLADGNTSSLAITPESSSHAWTQRIHWCLPSPAKQTLQATFQRTVFNINKNDGTKLW
jgi:hypothetical protein